MIIELFNMLSILSRHGLRSAAIFRTSPILDTSKHNYYYIKVSVWLEHPITISPRGPRTQHIWLYYISTSSPILDTSSHNVHRHTAAVIARSGFEPSLTCSPSCHVMGYAAPPYFAHHPYLIHQSTTTTSKSRCGSNTL